MRTLPAALLAAQQSDSAVPYLKAVVHDRIGGIRRLAWSRLYTGSEPDGYHAAAMPGGRIADPRSHELPAASTTSGCPARGRCSVYSNWTDLAAAANAGVALCADGSRVLLFCVDADGVTLKVRESTDNGATLGSAVTAATARVGGDVAGGGREVERRRAAAVLGGRDGLLGEADVRHVGIAGRVVEQRGVDHGPRLLPPGRLEHGRLRNEPRRARRSPGVRSSATASRRRRTRGRRCGR